MVPRYSTVSWKWLLIIFALLGVISSVFYSRHLSARLEQDERVHVNTWVEAQRTILQSSDSASITLATQLSVQNNRIPIIETNEKDSITGNYVNLDSQQVNNDPNFLSRKLIEFKRYQSKPIVLVLNENPYTANHYYYGKSSLLDEIRWYPIIQLLIAALFIALLIGALRYMARNQQQTLWVSMARETAHQLGTPVSNLKGWVELLKERPENIDIARELNKDVNRLQLVTDRFGKIGSAPNLEKDFPANRITEVVDYMSRRMGGQVAIHCDLEGIQDRSALISPPLFDWVIENLLKNALDALEGKGTISVSGQVDKSTLVIDITDTGKGMNSTERDAVFVAGFTT
ncbi:MAG: HAMP domain-containing histidine kinase, partial [Chitinophagaceae bacterium]|nr:HAMP domain-containing histidine kinase [Chitinophagaceae bacterium]